MVGLRHDDSAGQDRESAGGSPTGNVGQPIQPNNNPQPLPDREQENADYRCSVCGAPASVQSWRCASCMAPFGLSCADCRSISPRRAKFCAICGLELQVTVVPETMVHTERSAIERRHINVLVCDLVGSTALATAMDAEDFSELLGTVLRRIAEDAERFGGFVAQYLGDGVLIFFGYPSASENDTERAIWAALAMVDTVSAVTLPDGGHLAARVGIAAGQVVVGDIMGLGSPRGLEMVGALPSLAARLQAEAEPGTVVIDAVALPTACKLFDCRSLGERRLKGWNEPVAIWQVLRPAVDKRIEDGDRLRLAPLIGRGSAAARLASHWARAKTGAGRAVLVRGDPGIGKSRLVAELLQQLAGGNHARLHYSCSALQQSVPFAPCVRQLERAAGMTPDDGPQTRRAKLRAATMDTADHEFELIADLLGCPSTSQRVSQLSPHRRREQTITALTNLVLRLADERPVLLVCEDAHWIDTTSAELLGRMVRALSGRPILVVVAARPEFDPPWAKYADTGIIELGPLSMLESRELVGWVTGEARLSRDTVREITAKSDGVPLFLEEITKAFVESGSMVSTISDRTSSTPSMPSAIHSSLLARIDRLGGAREIAEVAAAIGRDFSLELLAQVTGLSELALRPMLALLVDSGLMQPCSPDGRQLRFKHALIQDAAYGLVVRSRRRALHTRIVHALETHFAKLSAAEPYLLAHHCTEAGLGEQAIAWWLRAGIQSLMRSATTEAIAQLARGLAIAQALPPTREREKQELDLRIAYAKALIATQGYARPSTGEMFAVARNLCERLGRPPQFLTVLHGQWSHALFGADFRAARRQSEEILRAAEASHDHSWLLVGYYSVGITSMPLGSFDRVCEYLPRGLAAANEQVQGRAAYAGPIVPNPVVIMQTYLSWALLCKGQLDEAAQMCRAAVQDARRLGQMFTLAFALWHEAYLTQETVSAEAALPLYDELHRVADEYGITFYEAVSTLFRGWSMVVLGDHSAGLALMREGREMYLRSANLLYMPSYIRMEAEALGIAGQPEAGLLVLDEADRLKDETDAQWDDAEFARARGELLWLCGRISEAHGEFRRGIRLAKARSARLFELRVALAYANKLFGIGQTDAAAALLIPVCGWFEGRGNCSELTRARRLVESCGPGLAVNGQYGGPA